VPRPELVCYACARVDSSKVGWSVPRLETMTSFRQVPEHTNPIRRTKFAIQGIMCAVHGILDEESALPEPLSKLESTELCGGFVTKFKEFQQKVQDADEKLGRRTKMFVPASA